MPIELFDLIDSTVSEEATPDLLNDKLAIADDSVGVLKFIRVFYVLGSKLVQIRGLTPTNDDVLQYKAGAWANRTLAQLKTDLGITSITGVLISGVNTALAGLIVGTDTILEAFGKAQSQINDLYAENSSRITDIATKQDHTRPFVDVDDGLSPYDIGAAEDGTIFTNKGSTGTIAFTLPEGTSCVDGKTRFEFHAYEAFSITVDPNAGDSIHFYNDPNGVGYIATNGSPLMSNGDLGSMVELLYRDTRWYVRSMNGRWTA